MTSTLHARDYIVIALGYLAIVLTAWRDARSGKTKP
jgi:hypothetical protein